MPAEHVKDPDATVEFEIDDFDELLEGGDSIASHTITADAGITVVSSTATGSAVTVRLSGGTVGTTYRVTARVTTADGLVDDRTIHVQVAQR